MAVAEKKVVKAVAPDKLSLFTEHDEVLRRIIAEGQREVDELNHRRELLIIQNRQLQDDLVRKQSQFDQNLRVEKTKHQEWINKSKNEEIARMAKVDFAEANWVRRDEEMKHREELGIKIVEKQNKINNDRLEIEKLRSSASAIMDDANRKMSEANSLFSQANIRESKAKETLDRANAINDSLNQRENALKEKEKTLADGLKNLEAIKEIVDPKIKEIKLIEDGIEKREKEVRLKEEQVERKIYEERELLKAVEISQKKHKDREKQLDQREEEITRKAILNKVDV